MFKQSCPYSAISFKCSGDNCPMHDDKFLQDINVWVLTGRHPKVNKYEPTVTSGSGNSEEHRMLKKARIAILFNNDELILEWIGKGSVKKINMTMEICSELKLGRKRYMEITNQEFADTNEIFREVCYKIGIEPTARQASRWKNRQGIAYKTWKGEGKKKVVDIMQKNC